MRYFRTDRFRSAYKKLTNKEQDAIDRKLAYFVRDPRHPSLRVKRWDKDTWYFRVSGDIRVFFEMHGDTSSLLEVGHHDIEKQR